MQAGSLDRQIQLLRYTPTAADGFGSADETYVCFAVVWASVMDLRGTQFIAAQQTNSGITTKFKIRHRTDLTARDRIEFNGRQYEIIGAPIEIGRNEGLEIMGKARDEL